MTAAGVHYPMMITSKIWRHSLLSSQNVKSVMLSVVERQSGQRLSTVYLLLAPILTDPTSGLLSVLGREDS